MNKLYILGAGASRELKFLSTRTDIATQNVERQNFFTLGALSSGFFFYANEFFKATQDIGIFGVTPETFSETLQKMIFQFYYKKYDSRITIGELLENETISERVNIEELYIWVEDLLVRIEESSNSQSVSSIEELTSDIAKDDLLKYVHKVFSTISYYCYSLYHRVLALYIEKAGGNILSFNWDILLEEEMHSCSSWNYRNGYGFIPTDTIDKNDFIREYVPLKEAHSSSVVLKPHGSINWYKKDSETDPPAKVYLGLPLTREGAWRGGTPPANGQLNFIEYMHASKKRRERFRSIIVPPGRKRKTFPSVWSQTRKLLEAADEIIAIGFSFNKYDPHVIEEIEDITLKDTIKIKIINPEKDIVTQYKKIFRVEDVSNPFDTFGEYCKWILTQEEMQDFVSLLS